MIPVHTSPIIRYTALTLLFSLSLLFSSINQAFAQSLPSGQVVMQNSLIPATFTFRKNLSKGMTLYPDVVHLKQFLNQDPRTALATDPCISPYADGYFDQRTKNALVQFQNIYRSEVLTPAGLRTASGVAGQYTRVKMNALLRTPAYAPIVASTTPNLTAANQSLQNAVNQYLSQVNQTLLQSSSTAPIATSTAPAQPLSSTTNPIVQSYLASVNQTLLNVNTNNVSTNNASTSTSTPVVQPNATQTPPVQANAATLAYFQSLNNVLNNTSATPSGIVTVNPVVVNPLASSTPVNPVVVAYLNTVNATLSQVSATTSTTTPPIPTVATTTTTTSTSSSTNLLPKILFVSPVSLTNCQQTITIIGQHFSPTQNLINGSIGTTTAIATTIATTSTSTIQSITLTLRDFSNYMYHQSIYAGQERRIDFNIRVNNLTSAEVATLRFRFPGEARSALAAAQTTLSAPPHVIAPFEIAGGGTGTSQSNSGSSGNGNGLVAGLVGLGVVIGVAAGVNALASGATAAASVVVGNFGGTLIANIPCTCSANTLITMQDVRGYPLQLIFQPGVSILYAYGVGIARPGAQLLGDYIRVPVQCLMYSGVSCTPFGLPIGVIRQVGTSI